MVRFRTAVRRRIPRQLRREIGLRMTPRWIRRWIPDIDLSVIDQFDDVDRLEDARRLEEFLPQLGISDNLPELFPSHLHWALGKGLRVWQYPCQFAPYLAYVARRPVGSYLEIGVEHGGSFITTVEFLRHQGHAVQRAVGADVNWTPGLARYLETRPYAQRVTLNSASATFRALARSQTWDLVLIDGDHSFNGCLTDWETVHDYANIIAFHDIVDSLATDVHRVWELIRRDYAESYNFEELVVQYPEVAGGRTHFGIGVAVRH